MAKNQYNLEDIPNLGDIIVINARVAREKIHFLNTTLDTHEDMGLMRTIDRHEGRIMFWIEPDFWNDFVAFAEAMRSLVNLEIGEIVNPELIPPNGRKIGQPPESS